MNKIIEKENIIIDDMIYEVRGVQVMLDSDIAKLYQVETKRVNEAVKNNPEKFPERFAFRISEQEYLSLKSKFSTSKGGSRKGHTVFTEQGLYMLATILKSKVATQVSIAIMDTFVKMRHYINYNKEFLPHKFMLLERKVDNNTKRINELFDKFNPKDIVKDYLFFEGEFYDAYSILLNILNKSQKEIIIIDNYAGKELLDILKKVDRKIVGVAFIFLLLFTIIFSVRFNKQSNENAETFVENVDYTYNKVYLVDNDNVLVPLTIDFQAPSAG